MDSKDFLIRLIELLCKAFDDIEFGDLLAANFGNKNIGQKQFDYAGLSPNLSFGQKVTQTVRFVDRFGQLELVHWFAQVASKARPERKDLANLVAEIEASVNPAAPVAAGPGKLPAGLVATLGLFQSKQLSLEDLAADLRAKFRAESHAGYDLPDQFHLSDLEPERIVAILALEAEPSPLYLRWLSERVTVERPYLGFIAAQALITAALRLHRDHLSKLRAVARSAVNKLSLQTEDPDVPASPAHDRKHELDVATELARMRDDKQAPGVRLNDLDDFLGALSKLRPAELDDLCHQASGTRMKYLGVRIGGPPELSAVGVVVKARQNNWEPELIRAALKLMPNDVVINSVHKKYGGVAV